MRLYLVQHGQARSKDEDPERPLTEYGRSEVQAVLNSLAKRSLAVSRIFHSGKTRARQTAEILSRGLRPPAGVEAADGLDPLAEPAVWADRLRRLDDDLMLVGHLPHLGRLAALLLCGDAERPVVAFRQAGVVCLERGEGGEWSVQWIVAPEVAGR